MWAAEAPVKRKGHKQRSREERNARDMNHGVEANDYGFYPQIAPPSRAGGRSRDNEREWERERERERERDRDRERERDRDRDNRELRENPNFPKTRMASMDPPPRREKQPQFRKEKKKKGKKEGKRDRDRDRNKDKDRDMERHKEGKMIEVSFESLCPCCFVWACVCCFIVDSPWVPGLR